MRRAARLLVALGAVCSLLPAAGAHAASIACPNQDTLVSAGNLGQARTATLCVVNAVRAQYGLPGLVDSPQLDSAAQAHTDDMVAAHYFSHLSPGGSTPQTRAGTAGYSGQAWAENIAESSTTPYQVVTAWMADVPHCATLLSPMYRDVGLGISLHAPTAGVPGDTWTQDFGLKLDVTAPSSDSGPASSCPHPLAAHMSPAPGAGQGGSGGGGSGGGGSGGGGSGGGGSGGGGSAAGQAGRAGRGVAPAAPIAAPALLLAKKRSVAIEIDCIAAAACTLSVQVSLVGPAAGVKSPAVKVRIGAHKSRIVKLPLAAAGLAKALRAKQPQGFVTLIVSAPAAGKIAGLAQIKPAG